MHSIRYIIHKMKRKEFYLPESQIEGLKEESRKTGFSMSELLRRAISAFLGNSEKKENGRITKNEEMQ